MSIESEQGSERPRPGGSDSDSSHLIRASAVVSGLGVVNKLLALVRAPAEAAIFGADRAMDALNVARQIPNAFSTWIEGPIRAAIVPLFTRRLHQEGEAEAWRAASNVINTLAVFLVLFVGLLVLGAEPLVRLFGAGFDDPEAWSLGTDLARIMAVSVAFSVLAVVLGSLQNVYRRQLYPALGRTINSATLLAGVLLLAPSMGQRGYAWGFLAGAVFAFLLQVSLVWRHRQHYRLAVRPTAPEIREVIVVSLPLFVGLMGTRVDVLIDTLLASYLPEGHLSVRVYGEMLALPATDLMLMISQAVMLPHFAHLVSQKRYVEMRGRLLQAAGGYLLLLLPVTAVLCVGARPIIDVLLFHGNFTDEKAALASLVVPIIALGAPPYLIGQLFAQAHISAGDTKTPMWIGFIRLGVKIPLSLALLGPLGLAGLVGSSAFSSYLRTFLLWWRLPKEYRPDGLRLLGLVGRLVFAASVGGAAAWALFELVAVPAAWGLVGQAAQLVVAAAAALLLTLGVAWMAGDEFIRASLRRLRGRMPSS